MTNPNGGAGRETLQESSRATTAVIEAHEDRGRDIVESPSAVEDVEHVVAA